MMLHLLVGDLPLIPELLHQGMIPGQLMEPPPAEQIGPAVPNMGKVYLLPQDDRKDDGGAHGGCDVG